MGAPYGPRPSLIAMNAHTGDDDDFYIDDNFDLSLLDRLAPQQKDRAEGGQSADSASPPESRALSTAEADAAAPAANDEIVIDDDFDLAQLERLVGEVAEAAPTTTEEQTQPAPSPASPHQQPGLDAPQSVTLTVPQATEADDALSLPELSLPELPRDLASDPLASLPDRDDARTRPWRWLVAALLMVPVILLATYGHRHAPTLALDPRLVPVLDTLCSITGCTLATPARETGGVSATQLVVRSHPNQLGLLRVDALLVNSASSEHMLPDLTLRFETLQGTLLEERRFTPHQYLYGHEVAGNPLAAGEAVRIRLDVLDPGDEAVSYRLITHDP